MRLHVPSAFLCLCTDQLCMVDIHLHSRAARFFNSRTVPCFGTVQVEPLLTTPPGDAGPQWIR
jgi:hypothetical protein